MEYVLIIGLCVADACTPMFELRSEGNKGGMTMEECIDMGKGLIIQLNKSVEEGQVYAFQCNDSGTKGESL